MPLSNVWPELDLTETERSFCAPYAGRAKMADGTVKKVPGVLKRIYPLTLTSTAVAGEISKLSDKFVPSSRVTRVFAMTFSGDLEWWQVKLSTVGGELLTNDFIHVPALLNCASVDGSAFGNDTGLASSLFERGTYQPLVFEPNIKLEGLQVIQVDGKSTLVPAAGKRNVLNIAFHVWEFPDPGKPLAGRS